MFSLNLCCLQAHVKDPFLLLPHITDEGQAANKFETDRSPLGSVIMMVCHCVHTRVPVTEWGSQSYHRKRWHSRRTLDGLEMNIVLSQSLNGALVRGFSVTRTVLPNAKWHERETSQGNLIIWLEWWDVGRCSNQNKTGMCISVYAWIGKYLDRTSFILFYFILLLFRAAPAACGNSQARDGMGAIAASLYHSHSNTGSKPHLWPTPQLTAMPDPLPSEQGQGSNQHPHGD